MVQLRDLFSWVFLSFGCYCLSIRKLAVHENLFHEAGFAGGRVDVDLYQIAHRLAPLVKMRAGGLSLPGKGKPVLGLVIAEQPVSQTPDRVIAHARPVKKLPHLGPDFLVSPDVFLFFSRADDRVPYDSFHNFTSTSRPGF